MSRSILPNISWDTPLSRCAKKLNSNVFLSAKLYTFVTTLIAFENETNARTRRQTILVFSTLKSAVQSLYSQKAT